MSLAEEYRRQLAWRSWAIILDALPLLPGHRVLDLGCAVGDQAAELAARGARVLGVDLDEELLQAARAKGLRNAEFRRGDLRALPDLGGEADGIWSSFAAAYMPELPKTLATWRRHLRPGGWIAVTEVDDFFGHEPVAERTRSLLAGYARDSFDTGRYDFHMGRKLRIHLEQSGFEISKELAVPDKELSFDGPALPVVIEAWRERFDRMKLLRGFFGHDYEQVRSDFLGCLARDDHRCDAKVVCCIAIRR